VLREALRRAGASARVTGAPKRGFNVPLTRLLRGPLAAEGDRLLDREVGRLEPWLRADGVRDLWRDVRAARTSEPYAAWALLSLAEWLAQRDSGTSLAAPGARG
jgi:asparagine synthase (glutamine-hydrolysing)